MKNEGDEFYQESSDGKGLIRKYKIRNGCLDQGFFRNFDGNLPGGYKVDWVQNGIVDINKTYAEPMASERRKGQTVGEFQDVCESALIEAEIDIDEYKLALNMWSNSDKSGRCEEGKKLFKMLEKTYLILRKRGYNHYPDLTG